MSNNLIIINAHIVTPQGRTARKGEAMNELLNIPCGTVRVTDGIITYVGENRISHEKPGYKVLDARGNVLLPGFVDSHTHLVFGGFRPDEFIWRSQRRQLYEHHGTWRRHYQYCTCHPGSLL